MAVTRKVPPAAESAAVTDCKKRRKKATPLSIPPTVPSAANHPSPAPVSHEEVLPSAKGTEDPPAAVLNDQGPAGAEEEPKVKKEKKDKKTKKKKKKVEEKAPGPNPTTKKNKERKKKRDAATPEVHGCQVQLLGCPPYFKDHHVYKAFEELGGKEAIERISMLVRPTTGAFRRGAFVTFHTKELAQRAVTLRPEVSGKVITVAWPKAVVKHHILQLYLSGWPKTVTDADVYDHFAKLGPNVVTRLQWMPVRGNRAACFATFSSLEQLQQAHAAGSFMFRNATIVVERPLRTLSPEERQKALATAGRCELFIMPVPKAVDNDALLTHYRTALGEEAVVQIRRDHGRIWLVFRTPDLAQRALELPRPPGLMAPRVHIKLNAPPDQ